MLLNMYIYLSILLLLAGAAFYPMIRSYILKSQKTADMVGGSMHRNIGKRKTASAVTALQRRTVKKKPAAKRIRRCFKAASIHLGSNCCQAAQDACETRYLLDDLPRLPLDSCDRLATCTCSFTNQPDRRVSQNRRASNRAFKRSDAGDNGVNRRSGMERRAGLGAKDQATITSE